MTTSAPQQRPRHLMDPDNPVRPVNDHSLTRVQRWVMSVLAVTTILHMSGGLVVAAVAMDDGGSGPVVLCFLAGVFGVIAVGAGLAIHQRNQLSPWLLLGVVPTVVGLLLIG